MAGEGRVRGDVPFDVHCTDVYGVSSLKAPIYSYRDRWDGARTCTRAHNVAMEQCGAVQRWTDEKTQCKNANVRAQKS